MVEEKKLLFEIGILIIQQVKNETFVGKRMIVKNNSYISTKGGAECRGLFGKVVEIISEPFEATVTPILGETVKHTCVNVRSIETGIEYRTLFCKNWICENHDVQKYGVNGKLIILSDGSYSKEINGDGKLYGCERAPMRIIGEPFAEKIEIYPNIYQEYLCAIAEDLRSGKFYHILFSEEDFVDEVKIIITIK